MKTIYKIFLVLFFLSAEKIEALEFCWLGSTHFIVRDDQTNIQFDPFVTHPSLTDFLFFRKVNSDHLLVNQWVNKIGLKSLDAIFVTHTHWDHVLDLEPFMKLSGSANIYGSSSARNFALGQNIEENRIRVIEDNLETQIKSFKVSAFKSVHTPHFMDILLMSGEIENPLALPTALWNLKEGGSYFVYLEHKNGNILFHSSSTTNPYMKDYKKYKPKILFLTIANRKSTKDQIDNIIKPLNPEIIIPMHFDNFFEPLKENPNNLPMVNADEWHKTISENLPNMKIVKPQIGQWLSL